MRILNVCLAASLCLSVRGNMRNIAILGGGQAAISVAETVQKLGWKASCHCARELKAVHWLHPTIADPKWNDGESSSSR